jgi:hypothetical protein
LPCGYQLTSRGAEFWAKAVDGHSAELKRKEEEEKKRKREGEAMGGF